MVLSIVDIVPSPINPLTDSAPHLGILQHENSEVVANAQPNNEVEMQAFAANGVI